ncbi:transcriptional regulator [Muricoccus nepalensis]|uniref:transcriptional regulator n=1 Tax=Muricoccus nepalensis TaxID=1854500 RepID=UPI0013866E50|nr:transcriptional regulator [Roseomonas nepalensis]
MLAFVDFEASSLSGSSYPIEVGWCTADEQTTSHLIHPARTWNEWSAASEAMHGITRDRLFLQGRPATEVAHDMVRALLSHEVPLFSDAPAWDQVWLHRLLLEAGLKRRGVLHDVQQAFGHACQPLISLIVGQGTLLEAQRQEIASLSTRLVAEATDAEANRRRIRHRAGPDAEGLWWTWRYLQDHVAREVSEASKPRMA